MHIGITCPLDIGIAGINQGIPPEPVTGCPIQYNSCKQHRQVSLYLRSHPWMIAVESDATHHNGFHKRKYSDDYKSHEYPGNEKLQKR